MQETVKGWICKQPVLNIEYEDILQDGKLNTNLSYKMAAFLEVTADWETTPKLTKVSPPMETYVENFEDIKNYFQGKRFENMTTSVSDEVKTPR